MSTTAAKPAAAEEAAPAKSKKKLIIILVVALLVVGGGAYKFMLAPASAAPSGPTPGTVVPLEPIQINLAGEHYLRIGVALQLTSAAKEADGSKALDATIDEFSGRTMAEVTSPMKRRQLKRALTKHLEHLYEGEVMGIYFTEFVTQ